MLNPLTAMIPFSMLRPTRNGSIMNALAPCIDSKESNQMIVKPVMPVIASANRKHMPTFAKKLRLKYFASFIGLT